MITIDYVVMIAMGVQENRKIELNSKPAKIDSKSGNQPKKIYFGLGF